MSANQDTRFAVILYTHDLFVKRSTSAEKDLTLFQRHRVTKVYLEIALIISVS